MFILKIMTLGEKSGEQEMTRCQFISESVEPLFSQQIKCFTRTKPVIKNWFCLVQQGAFAPLRNLLCCWFFSYNWLDCLVKMCCEEFGTQWTEARSWTVRLQNEIMFLLQEVEFSFCGCWKSFWWRSAPDWWVRVQAAGHWKLMFQLGVFYSGGDNGFLFLSQLISHRCRVAAVLSANTLCWTDHGSEPFEIGLKPKEKKKRFDRVEILKVSILSFKLEFCE